MKGHRGFSGMAGVPGPPVSQHNVTVTNESEQSFCKFRHSKWISQVRVKIDPYI